MSHRPDRSENLTARLQERAGELGFDLLGLAPAAPPTHGAAFTAWLAQGYHGEMKYLARQASQRLDPQAVLPGAQTIIAVAASYYTGDWPDGGDSDSSRGLIARYAWGQDYHQVLQPRLEALLAFLQAEAGRNVHGKVYVGDGPVLERDVAAHAGLGFIGKNACLIHPRLGSWLSLGVLLVDVDICATDFVSGEETRFLGENGFLKLSGDLWLRGDCGSCTCCLEACPTAAFPQPYVLDARRCISYLTIELRSSIPRELRPLMGNRIFGCDVCQEVCPWNHRLTRPTAGPAFQPRPAQVAPSLLSLLNLDEAAFQARFAGTSILRTKRRGLLRNVAVALGNSGDPAVVPALTQAIADPEPLVRGHVAWALGQLNTPAAREALAAALAREPEPQVVEEIQAALA
jgi:epoxyqueuosine reductase